MDANKEEVIRRDVSCNRCLFCVGEVIEVKDETEPGRFLPGSDGSAVVDKHLWAFFVLRDVVNYPIEEITRLLQSSGGKSISEWFALCENCKVTVKGAMTVYMELLKLREKLKGFKEEVKKIVRTSLGNKLEQDVGMTSFSKEIRDYFKEANDLLKPPPSPPSMEDYETSSSSHDDWSMDDHNQEDPNDNSDSDLEWTPKSKRMKPPEIKLATDIYSSSSEDDEVPTEKTNATKKSPSKSPPSRKPKKARKQKRPSGPPFLCKICNPQRIFANAHALMRHFREHRIFSHSCPNCNYPLRNESRLNKHLEKNMCDPNNLLKCDQCDFYTESQAHIQIHRLAVHRVGVKQDRTPKTKIKRHKGPFICDICGVKKQNQNTLDYHVKAHQYYKNCEVVDGQVKCKMCGELTPGKLEFRRHVRALHASELGLTVFQCPHCPKNFPLQRTLDSHVADNHSKQFKFQCEHCGYGTNVVSSLKRHMLTHQSERPFSCDQCDATFKLMSTLKGHLEKVHNSGENGNKVNCKYCGEEVNANYLKTHLREVHKEMFKHKCDLCGKEYLHADQLRYHKRLSHGRGPVKCPFCEKTYLSEVHLKTHLKKRCQMKPEGYTLENNATVKVNLS